MSSAQSIINGEHPCRIRCRHLTDRMADNQARVDSCGPPTIRVKNVDDRCDDGRVRRVVLAETTGQESFQIFVEAGHVCLSCVGTFSSKDKDTSRLFGAVCSRKGQLGGWESRVAFRGGPRGALGRAHRDRCAWLTDRCRSKSHRYHRTLREVEGRSNIGMRMKRDSPRSRALSKISRVRALGNIRRVVLLSANQSAQVTRCGPFVHY
eukprot:5264016-Prymnesium_polylepis.1